MINDIKDIERCGGAGDDVHVCQGELQSSALISFKPLSPHSWEESAPAVGSAMILSESHAVQLNNAVIPPLMDPANCIPNHFMVTVPRLYPHQKPLTRCMEPSVAQGVYLDRNGYIHHPELGENWSAVKNLSTVVEVLRQIRLALLQHMRDQSYATISAVAEEEEVTSNGDSTVESSAEPRNHSPPPPHNTFHVGTSIPPLLISTLEGTLLQPGMDIPSHSPLPSPVGPRDVMGNLSARHYHPQFVHNTPIKLKLAADNTHLRSSNDSAMDDGSPGL